MNKLLVLILTAGLALVNGKPMPDRPVRLDFDSVKSLVMDPNGVSLKDIALYPTLSRPQPFLLSRVGAILRDPFELENVTAEILSRTAPETQSSRLPIAPDSLWPLLDLEKKAAPDSQTGSRSPLDTFDVKQTLNDIREGLRVHTDSLTDIEKNFLFREASGLFLQEEEDTLRTAVANELQRLESEARLQHIMEVAGKLHREGLAKASSAAWRLETWLIEAYRNGKETSALAQLKAAAGKTFPVKVGSKGSDRHVVGPGIFVDPGGDDEYRFASTIKPGSFTLILDVSGNDLYLSKDSLHQSAGNLGVSVMADLAGSDRYLSENFGFASALFGFASLFDLAGHDSYEGRCATQGFGFFGIGVLQDESGNDLYSASLMSQGAGSTMGAGLLLDRSGDDRYIARPTFQDDLRYTDHYLQMVQGFGTGFAPDFAGGIGLLRDTKGNDFYLADIFGQGSGYWYSLGMLIDEAGDDKYSAHQYAQGAGVHIAIGAHLDFGGNDTRGSKGVSQGTGHDYGFGYLYDKSGDDNYLATDMSQGAGSANGLGMLQDGDGDDSYMSLNPDQALGHADMRRDRGSFGFFLDRHGRDKYTKPQLEGSAWRVFNGKTKGNGFGLDK